MPSPILHVRADEEMIEKIDAFAAQLKVDRSVAVRTLIGAALGDPPKTIAAREALMMLSQQRKLVLAKFNDALQNAIEELQANIGAGS
jgi:hypothetical protein